MTAGPDDPAQGGGTAALLRALGSLMATLGGEEAGPAPPALGWAATPRPRPLPEPEPVHAPPAPAVMSDQATLLLADARQRAQRLLDESMERAAELLARRGPAQAEGDEGLRRSVDELVVGMRDVVRRLDHIEALLQARPAVWAVPPVEERPRAGDLSLAEPPPLTPARAPLGARGVPASAVPPPARIAAQPAYAPAPPPPLPARETHDAPYREVAQAAAAPAAAAVRAPGAALVTFAPADGSVLLRAAPVSGFQGLMRLQDALARLPAVRQATVEAYAQGEARLRLDLAAALDGDTIARGLAPAVGQVAAVREASEADRTILIVFG